MALFSECMLECARKVLDTADIVRDACFRQLQLRNGTSPVGARRSATPNARCSGAGAKPKPKIVAYTLTKGLAAKFLADQLTERRWQELRDAADQRLRFDVEKYIWDRAAGRPAQQMRVPSPEGEKFQVEVDVTSACKKLLAALGG